MANGPAVVIDYDRPIRILNAGQEPWRDWYNSREFNLQPGQQTIVPYAAILNWFGDPDLRDSGDRYLRSDEYRRLGTRYGWHIGESEEEWRETRMPRIKCFTLEDEPILTVLDDPNGESLKDKPATSDQYSYLEQTVQRQEAELAQMRKVLHNLQASQGAEEAIPEDEPKQVPTGARRGSRG